MNIGDLRKKENQKYRGLWREIAQRLPERTETSVYRRGMRLLNPFKTGAWSEGEMKLLAELVEKYGAKWTRIQSEVNRSAEACADKWREIKGRDLARMTGAGTDKDGGKSKRRGYAAWSEEETQKLRGIIRSTVNHSNPAATFEEMFAKAEEDSFKISFTAISKQLGTNRSRLDCYEKYLRMAGKDRQRKRKDASGKKPAASGGAKPAKKAK